MSFVPAAAFRLLVGAMGCKEKESEEQRQTLVTRQQLLVHYRAKSSLPQALVLS